MLWTFTLKRTLLAIVAISCLTSPVAAEPKPATGGGLAVDVVSLKSGRSLRGVIAWQEPSGSLTMAVSRDGLAATNRPLSDSALKENLEGRQAGWAQSRERILERLKRPNESPHLVFFFKQELERLDQLLADPKPSDPDFLWVDLRHESIAKVSRTVPDRQRIALFAWNERLTHVETRDVTSLLKEMTDRGVKLDGPPPDLTDRLPARPQDDEEWAARMAIVEYTLAKSLDFQGMGDALARTREGEPANLGEVLPKLLQQQLGSLLKDLTNDGRQPPTPKGDAKWLASAIRQAELAKIRGFRVTRLELDTNAARVTVESRFVAQVAEGKWRTVWRAQETGDATKVNPQAEVRIEQDPQLKSAIDMLKSLGLADSETRQKAIRVGAATMAAQQASDSAFAEFRDRYVRRLDSPPLPMTVGP